MGATPAAWIRSMAERLDDTVSKSILGTVADALEEKFPYAASSGLSAHHLRFEVVRPALGKIGLWDPNAEELLLGTAAQESLLRYLVQLGGGPGRGLFQIEPATHTDIWRNHVRFRADLAETLRQMAGGSTVEAPDVGVMPHHSALVTNLAYSTAIARLKYRMIPAPLPFAADLEGMAAYWKQHYNTPLGGGTVSEFIENYRRLIQGVAT